MIGKFDLLLVSKAKQNKKKKNRKFVVISLLINCIIITVIFGFLVEKIGLICQFLVDEHIIGSGFAQSAVIHGVCFLTTAVEDVDVTVSVRARSIIQSIKISSLKVNK